MFCFFRRLSAADQAELLGHIQVFLAEKRFEGCAGLEVTDEMRVVIASQACLLLLHRKSLLGGGAPHRYGEPVCPDVFGVIRLLHPSQIRQLQIRVRQLALRAMMNRQVLDRLGMAILGRRTTAGVRRASSSWQDDLQRRAWSSAALFGR